MVKNYSIIAILTLIMISALIYGIMESGTPWDSRGKKFDDTRLSDLNNIKYAIDTYYSTNHILPTSLNDLNSANSYSTHSNKDPETNQPYEYKTTGNTSYQLCANFSQKTNTSKLNDIYYQSGSTQITTHQKGHYCFDMAVSSYLLNNLSNSSLVNNKRQSITSTQLAPPAIASASAQVIADSNISSVTEGDNTSYLSSVTSSDPKYSAHANFPYGFFSSNGNEWGLISSNPAPVTVTVNFKHPVGLDSVTTDFTPGCAVNNLCINWKVVGVNSTGTSINLYENNVGTGTPYTASINSTDQFSKIITTASMNSAHEIGYLYWKKLQFSYK